MQHEKLHPTVRDETLGIDAWWHIRQVFLHHAQVSFPIECKHCLCRAGIKRVGRGFDCAIVKLICGFEVLVGAIIVGKIYEDECVLWTEGCGFLQIGRGLSPFALATLNRSNRHVDFR